MILGLTHTSHYVCNGENRSGSSTVAFYASSSLEAFDYIMSHPEQVEGEISLQFGLVRHRDEYHYWYEWIDLLQSRLLSKDPDTLEQQVVEAWNECSIQRKL